MKNIIFAILFCTLTFNGNAQNNTDSIHAVIHKLFEGMRTSDTAMIASCFAENAVMQTIITTTAAATSVIPSEASHSDRRKEPQNKVKTVIITDFIKSIGNLKSGDADEKITVLSTLEHNGLAVVWASYKFYYKGQFSHCGIDSFQLVKLINGWKIQYLIDTRSKDHCD